MGLRVVGIASVSLMGVKVGRMVKRGERGPA